MNTVPRQIIRHIEAGETCCNPEWEAAYRRFETPEEEIDKFVKRLQAFRLPQKDRSLRIIELFCGRGGGLQALERLGFRNLEGVDLSETLLQECTADATLHLADCRSLPFEDDSCDVAIVQGGLHHLPTLPDDLDRVLSDVSRILKPDGTFYVVEPWQTPFLRFVHLVVERPLMRRLYAKGDALAEMTEHERETYEQWLGQPQEILELFHRHFETIQEKRTWGKLRYAGRPISQAS
ncbi:MAG: class I SAM-dependent methyltransferase [Rubripirellula sp.]